MAAKEARRNAHPPTQQRIHQQEELGILREALDTIAQSSIAATQIGVCLAMEAREEGSDEKAKILQKVHKRHDPPSQPAPPPAFIGASNLISSALGLNATTGIQRQVQAPDCVVPSCGDSGRDAW